VIVLRVCEPVRQKIEAKISDYQIRQKGTKYSHLHVYFSGPKFIYIFSRLKSSFFFSLSFSFTQTLVLKDNLKHVNHHSHWLR
jgi:hypothetical protein